MIRAAAAIALGLALLAGAAHAQQAPVAQGQTYFGMAGVQCAEFNKAGRTSDMLYHQASQWLLGYISGMNVAMRQAKGSVPASTLTNDQILKLAGAHCETNPDTNLANAANQWYALLPKQTDPQAAAEARSGSGSLQLNLDNAPKIKPLLDRH